MRKKINHQFIIIALFSIVVTTLAMTGVFYSQLKRQVFSDLKIVAGILVQESVFQEKVDGIRITLVDERGVVEFDSLVEATTLENHMDRPEIKDAIATGEGHGVRNSDTLSESVFYYAVKLSDGRVLRVGKEAHSVFMILATSLPIVVGVAILLAFVCMILSRYLTKTIIRPIENMAGDMDHISEDVSYPEIVPFIRKIRTQHEEILAAANTRQEFTANVTHELKTPLAAISGYAELMEAGMVGEKEIKHFSGEIRKSAARLLTLINDIIQLSSLDAGNAKESLEIVNLAAIASESVEMLSIHAAKNQVEVIYEGEASAEVRIGKELGQELVYNLIENAVRYNKPEGKVWVRVNASDNGVTLSVEDTGIGIPKEHQKRIFERFYRVDKSRSKELGGTGLGLAIVKHICILTGAELNLESEPDKGTKMTVKWNKVD